MEPKVCSRCSGSGLEPSGDKCWHCKGRGNWPAPDVRAIVDQLFTRKRGPRRFRRSFPDGLDRFGDFEAGRAYFVWRLVRFHGGIDVTMPMTAHLVLHGDPWWRELDDLAGWIAKKVFGTEMAGAARWGQALGVIDSAPAGLPDTAYPGGPVVIGDKPEFELEELK